MEQLLPRRQPGRQADSGAEEQSQFLPASMLGKPVRVFALLGGEVGELVLGALRLDRRPVGLIAQHEDHVDGAVLDRFTEAGQKRADDLTAAPSHATCAGAGQR